MAFECAGASGIERFMENQKPWIYSTSVTFTEVLFEFRRILGDIKTQISKFENKRKTSNFVLSIEKGGLLT